jgi:hypothetical protein
VIDKLVLARFRPKEAEQIIANRKAASYKVCRYFKKANSGYQSTAKKKITQQSRPASPDTIANVCFFNFNFELVFWAFPEK